MNCVLQEVQFTDQQRFKQFVSQSKARMEVSATNLLIICLHSGQLIFIKGLMILLFIIAKYLFSRID